MAEILLDLIIRSVLQNEGDASRGGAFLPCNVLNANKKVKVGQDEVKFGSSNEKCECSKEVASESSSEKEVNANKKLGETTVASSNVKKLVTGSSAGASKVLVKIFIVLRLAVQENLT